MGWGYCSHRKKRMRQLQKKIKNGTLNIKQDDPFELFVAATNIRYCYYNETHKILGNTFGMCVLQVSDFLQPGHWRVFGLPASLLEVGTVRRKDWLVNALLPLISQVEDSAITKGNWITHPTFFFFVALVFVLRALWFLGRLCISWAVGPAITIY